VVQKLENGGQGLNLTHEVCDGILKHSKGYGKIIPEDPAEQASTTEGRIVRIADIMAYLNHDLDDAIRSGVIRAAQVPACCQQILGESHQERINTMMRDLIFSSKAHEGELVLTISEEVSDAMAVLREFLYDNVYRSERVHTEFVKAKKIMSELFAHFLENDALLDVEIEKMGIAGCPNDAPSKKRLVCDVVASMTDRYAMDLYAKIFFPTPTV
jgi:dGTPase